MKLRILLLTMVLAAMSVTATAVAQELEGDSTLNPWAVTSEVFVEGGEEQSSVVNGWNCHEVESAIDQHNEGLDIGDQIWVPPLSYIEADRLYAWLDSLPPELRPGGFDDTDLQNCTTVHVDGWKPATESLVNLAGGSGSGLVTINVTGFLGCGDHGEVLMASASYYWYNGRWESFFGTNWVENPGGGVLAQGDVTFECVTIVPGDPGDFANVQDAVPNAQVLLNPAIQGLTGLDTWLWYDFTIPDSAELFIPNVTIFARGTSWTLDANVWVDRVHWDLDCAANCTHRAMEAAFDFSGYDYELDLPDTFDLTSDPAVLTPAGTYDGGEATAEGAAATHIYRTKDDYTVSTATVWRGYWTFLGLIYPYDPVVVAEGETYDVVEVRSVLIDPDV